LFEPQQLDGEVAKFKKQLIQEEYSSLVVIISSHGHFNGIMMSDGDAKNLWIDFVYPFSETVFPEFQSKPKIFISNACLKFKAGTTMSTIEKEIYGSTRDIMVLLSCMPGYGSSRDPSENGTGSLFIHLLLETIMEHFDSKHLKEIMDIVKEKQDSISQIRIANGKGKYQVGCCLDGIFKKFYF